MKTYLTAALLLLALGMSAQSSLGLSYTLDQQGAEIGLTYTKIQGKWQHYARLGLQGNGYLLGVLGERDFQRWGTLRVGTHYHFRQKPRSSFYAYAELKSMLFKPQGDFNQTSATVLGRAGVGWQKKMGNHWYFNAELGARVNDVYTNYGARAGNLLPELSLGLTYRFGK